MFKVISISTLLVFLPFLQLSHAEVVDESWRQVYEFQSKMAAKGNNKAQFTLGEMYEHGRGVERNYDTAIDWYNRAKSNGHSEASERIAMIHQSIKEDEKQAKVQRQAEEELARQKAAEQQRAADAKRKQQALDKKRAAKAKKATKKKKAKLAKLTPEERAKKIKEAQERAKEIAKQNQIKHQQEADAALKKYKQEMAKAQSKAKAKEKPKQSNTMPEKYMDAFE